jgi:hypothetical protein
MIKTTAEIARELVKEHNLEKQRELQAKADEELAILEEGIIESAKRGYTGRYFTTSPSVMPLICKALKEAGFAVYDRTESSGTVDWSGVEA